MITDDVCTGCGACAASCPKQAISMIVSAYGEKIPKINNKQCVNCNLCKKICPQNSNVKKNDPMSCYAVFSKNQKDYIFSASGGAATIFASYMIDMEGAAYGCDYNEQGELIHFKLKTLEDIEKAQSSKYSQSSAYEIFEEVKKELRQRKVLFIGTPCQVAGLKSFVGESENLLTVDLICHGTPPTKILQDHIRESVCLFPVNRIRFRGEYDQMLTVWKDNQICYQKSRMDDLYFSSFYRNLISRKSCYYCKYACSERVADITIGDFWGLGELRTIEKKSNRPSVVLLNTTKGVDFFRNVKFDLFFEERTVEEAVKGNGRLNNPPGEKIDAKLFRFFYSLNIFGFKKSVYITNYFMVVINFLKKYFGGVNDT